MTEAARAAWRPGLAVILAIIIVDQITKWWILLGVMNPPRVIEVLPIFNLVLVWNRGVSFSLMGGGAVPPWALAVMSIVISIALGIWMVRAASRTTAICLGIVIGGALGNVIDRFVHGAVVDFLDFHAFGWHWPAFNVADSAIVIGALALVLESLFQPASPPK